MVDRKSRVLPDFLTGLAYTLESDKSAEAKYDGKNSMRAMQVRAGIRWTVNCRTKNLQTKLRHLCRI